MDKKTPYFSMQVNGREADVYIFGDIVDDRWYSSETSAYSLATQLQMLDPDVREINLHIDSYGGSVAAGWGIYNALRNRQDVTIRTYADGFVASAAIYPFLAGSERIASSTSAFYFHPASMEASGYAEDLRKAADKAESITKIGLNAFVDVAGISLERAQQLIDSKTWYSPAQILDLGIATSISGRSRIPGMQQSVREMVVKQLLCTHRPPVFREATPPPAAQQTPPPPKTEHPSLMQMLASVTTKA